MLGEPWLLMSTLSSAPARHALEKVEKNFIRYYILYIYYIFLCLILYLYKKIIFKKTY